MPTHNSWISQSNVMTSVVVASLYKQYRTAKIVSISQKTSLAPNLFINLTQIFKHASYKTYRQDHDNFRISIVDSTKIASTALQVWGNANGV